MDASSFDAPDTQLKMSPSRTESNTPEIATYSPMRKCTGTQVHAASVRVMSELLVFNGSDEVLQKPSSESAQKPLQ